MNKISLDKMLVAARLPVSKPDSGACTPLIGAEAGRTEFKARMDYRVSSRTWVLSGTHRVISRRREGYLLVE